jgi:hypothetical protein
MGIGQWALGIKEVRMRECVNKYDSFYAPCPMPYALCPILLYFATKVAKSGKSIGLEI